MGTLGEKGIRTQRGREFRQIWACRSRLTPMSSSKNRSIEVGYKGCSPSIPSLVLPTVFPVHRNTYPIPPSGFIAQLTAMPVIQTRPQGHTVRLANVSFCRREAHKMGRPELLLKVITSDLCGPVGRSSASIRISQSTNPHGTSATSI